MDRLIRAFYGLLVVVALLGGWCFVGDVWWWGYFPALRGHLWLGLALTVLSVPAIAGHVRRTRSPVLASLLAPGVLLIVAGWLTPGRPEYPAFGPIGWAAMTTGVHLLLTAAAGAVLPRPERAPAAISLSGIALTVGLIYTLHLGVFGWLLRGDERWGPMLAHSALGVLCLVLVLPHLVALRRALGRLRGAALTAGIAVGLTLLWHGTYPHDLVLLDFRSPTDFATQQALTGPPRDAERLFAAIPGTSPTPGHDWPMLDPAVVGDSRRCGDSGCHETITRQWAGSAHRFAAANDFYAAVITELVREQGAAAATFCAGCHDPVRVLAGQVEAAYADGAPEGGDGVSCVVCHGTWPSDRERVNGAILVRQPKPYPGADQQARNANIRLDPRAHRQDLVSNFRLNDPSEACEACHRVELGPAVGATWTGTLQSAFEPGERTPLACTDCHMPTLTINRGFEQAVYDHHLSGMNLDLARYARVTDPDYDGSALALVQANTAAFLAGSLELEGLLGEARVYEIPGETATVLRKGGALALAVRAERVGSLLRVRTTTTNHRAGHAFPIGAFDLNEVWQQVVVTDGSGAVVAQVGALGEDLRVDPEAARLGAVELGPDGQPLQHHRIWTLADVRDKRQIPRGGSVDDAYLLPVPPGALRVQVRWNYRRANQDFVDWVYRGDGTTFPVHELAFAEAVVP